ncbi:hypothetical protein SCHPADRAFT_169265 [Schizopora paradoxa]|uniref:Ricin B lectin domain-containing protein n=1 Tax=Schizopora paradoxa TaxID=27342 RepID=A0A0H2S0E9_9AGAM|nr:hypothetical protein SCHPADRAFT_169265 [Schizopora paradoxa]
MLRNGTYILENCGISRAVDLNGADHCSLIAHPKHGWANQQWRFTGLGKGWAISSALKPIGDGYVLPLLGSRSGIGYDLMTCSFPVAWDVKGAESPGPKGEGTDAIYQISWPRSDFVLEVNVSEKETKLNLGNKSPCPIEEAALHRRREKKAKMTRPQVLRLPQRSQRQLRNREDERTILSPSIRLKVVAHDRDGNQLKHENVLC